MRLQPKATVIQKCLAPTTDAQLSKSGLNLVDMAWELCALRATSHFLTAARKRREPGGVAGSPGEKGGAWERLPKTGGMGPGHGAPPPSHPTAGPLSL